MNNNLKKINEESILFFDLESAKNTKDLDPKSKEYALFNNKFNKSGELTEQGVIDLYNDKAPLTMCYNRIVSVGVGFIKQGKLYIKSIDGEESEIIKEFCSIANNFDYLCGLNIESFDTPMLYNNGYRYFDMSSLLMDKFVTSNKKPWELDKSFIDLMKYFKGTHFMNSSIDEICYHFGIESPKTDMDGSMVSHEFWTNGVEKISKYVKQDVLAAVNIFKRMRWEDAFTTYTDRTNVTIKQKEQTVLEKLYDTKNLSNEVKTLIKDLADKNKLTKKDKVSLEKIVLAHYLSKEDKADLKKEKTLEVKQFIENL